MIIPGLFHGCYHYILPPPYWRGWRLTALDGTQFNVTNTPQNNQALGKAKTRRGRAAFAKITTSVLLELGLHNPLAAAIGHHGQSEWQLSLSLLAQLPKQVLLLADRLSGCAAFVAQALKAYRRVGSHLLVRARTQIKVQVLRRFQDGSRLIRVPVRQKGKPRQIVEWLELREIRVQLHRKGHRPTELRLWTSLLDPKMAPASELVELYTKRWEHELFYRELKGQLCKSALLQSHTVTTAAQEIAALLLAAALLAKERDRAAAGQVPVLRISFPKLLELLRPLWLTLALADDILQEWQKQELADRFYRQAGRCLTPKRRARSCPRKVRQPVSGWPRLMKNEYTEGPVSFKFRLFRNVLGVFHWAGCGSSPPKGCSGIRAGRFGCSEHQPEHVPRNRVGTSMRRSPTQTRRDIRRSAHSWPLPWTNLGPRAVPQPPYALIACFSSLKAVFSGFYPLNRRYTPAIWHPTPSNRQ